MASSRQSNDDLVEMYFGQGAFLKQSTVGATAGALSPIVAFRIQRRAPSTAPPIGNNRCQMFSQNVWVKSFRRTRGLHVSKIVGEQQVLHECQKVSQNSMYRKFSRNACAPCVKKNVAEQQLLHVSKVFADHLSNIFRRTRAPCIKKFSQIPGVKSFADSRCQEFLHNIGFCSVPRLHGSKVLAHDWCQ